MSDSTNTVPLDPNSSSSSDPSTTDADSIASESPPPDPSATDQTATDSSSGSGTPPDSGSGTVGSPSDGTTDTSAEGVAQNGAGSGSTDTPSPLPSLNPQPAAVTPPSSGEPLSAPQQPSALPNSSPPLSLGGKSDSNTKTIIIASSVSGGVALLLALAVILFVYRRRFLRRRDATFVNAMPSTSNRRGSDATWIGPPAGKSYDDDKLEAGNRNSHGSLQSETTTLADFVAARAKSGAFSTPSHTPKPSLDKINTQLDPLVPADPFEKPNLAVVDKPRSSLDQVPTQPVTVPRQRGPAPGMRINSGNGYDYMVQIEQGDIVGPQSPGSPYVPLVTPLEPPPGWRGSRVEFIRAPTRRDSMVSLSRQSSRASSRNSQIIEAAEDKPRTGFNSILAKKRRSRADSIDPFRKSAATIAARRKSRAASIASTRYNAYGAPAAPGARRKSRAESIAPPMTPNGRRKSRAGSIAPSVAPRRRSQAASSIASPRQSSIFSAPVDFMPPAPIGLPRTPRTPTAARQSRVPEPRTPRTPRTSAPREPRTPVAREPRTPVAEREPRTPATARTPYTPGGHPRTPSARVPRTPTSLDDAVHWSAVPLPAVPASTSRPLPSVPITPTRAPAELRLSQLSRALSEVSSRGSPI
ncbi:hypothetical protein FKP32DRAFT_1218492 [Trametes sanguinea]|nr:hypothetical protein FKP32DRAFT_1218492 [Trametes sanguinea]